MRFIFGLTVLILPLFLGNCKQKTFESKPIVLSITDSTIFRKDLFEDLEREAYDLRMLNSKRHFERDVIYCGRSYKLPFNFHPTTDASHAELLGSDISKKIIDFYSHNLFSKKENLNYPTYSKIKENEIEDLIKIKKQMIENIKSNKNNKKQSDEILTILLSELHQAALVNYVFKNTKKKEVFQLNCNHVIQVEHQDSFLLSKQYLSGILLGSYELRNLLAQAYFEQSYLRIYAEFRITRNEDSKMKLELLSYLHPINLIDAPWFIHKGIKAEKIYGVMVPSR